MFVAPTPVVAWFLDDFREEALMCAMWTDDDVASLHAMAADFGEAFPVNLAKLMAHESGCDPAAINWVYERDEGGKVVGRHAGAVGLIQFEPDVLRGLWWTKGTDAFARLTVAQQLPYVRRFLLPHAAAIRAGGLGVLYTAVFLPALVARAADPTFVLCALQGPLAWAYSANATFDHDGKGWITPADLARAAEEFYARTPAAQDLATRLAKLDAMPDTQPEIADVTDRGNDATVYRVDVGPGETPPDAA